MVRLTMAVAAGVKALPQFAPGFAKFGNNFAVPALFLTMFPNWFAGLAFADHTMTYFRDPVTHHCDQGRFDSPDRALRRYSRGESRPVRLVWLR